MRDYCNSTWLGVANGRIHRVAFENGSPGINKPWPGVIYLGCALAAALACGGGCTGDPSNNIDGIGTIRAAVVSGPPTLYRDPQHESPVRGDPGDVLLIPGDNFAAQARIVYEAVGNTGQVPAAPSSIPAGQTAALGSLTPFAVDANAVTVHLPTDLTAGQSYVLWAGNPDVGTPGAYLYSSPILINDARPMWISPGPDGNHSTSFAYRTIMRPGLSRDLKIIGRNLQPAPGATTKVRFTSTTNPVVNRTLFAADDGNPATHIENYVAKVTLSSDPQSLSFLPVDTYTVAVSRDGTSWVPLILDPQHPQDPSFAVVNDPSAVVAQFDVSTFGQNTSNPNDPYLCKPDDGIDDTYCITRAIHYAEMQGGGDVVFPAGTWLVSPDPSKADWSFDANWRQYGGSDSYVFPSASTPSACPLGGVSPSCKYQAIYPLWGLRVPAGVNLIGTPGVGSWPTTIVTDKGFVQPFFDYVADYDLHQQPPIDPTIETTTRQSLFFLFGNHIVRDLRFHDNYAVTFKDQVTKQSVTGPSTNTLTINGSDIVVTNNFFDDTAMGIKMSNWALLPDITLGTNVRGNARVIATGNVFATNFGGISTYAFEDSVIAGNTFWAGTYDIAIPVGVSGSHHLDVSSNIVDGTKTTYSGCVDGGCVDGHTGFRAGFFFPSVASQEELLVSGNQISCVGTRDGYDGEAITTDANQDTIGFKSGEWVSAEQAPTATTVTVDAADRMLTDSQYAGHWLRIAGGPGLGQTRRIQKAETMGSHITFTVSPAFDVVPVAGHSRVLVAEQAWQLYYVDNTIDNTCSAKLTNLGTHWIGGLIAFFGNVADSVIDGNVQIDTGGISLNSQLYSNALNTLTGQFGPYFTEVRNNSISGSYGLLNGEWNPCNYAGSGVQLYHQVGRIDNTNTLVPTSDRPGFGISISHNTIQNAALRDPGSSYTPAIVVGWGGNWGIESLMPGFSDTVVYGNAISSIPSPPSPSGVCGYSSSIWPGTSSAAISNGEKGTLFLFLQETESPNYPKNTVLCDNTISGPNQAIIDAPPGQPSSLIVCPPPPPLVQCGLLPCPNGATCADIPNDGCDPLNGGSDCPGTCQGGSPNDM
jgi:hypothetical protein